MIKLKNYKKQSGGSGAPSSNAPPNPPMGAQPTGGEGGKRVSVRDKLLIKEIEELERTVPSFVTVKFDDPDRLYDFHVIISPEEGDWSGGHFRFHVLVPEGYNIEPPTVTCLSKLWHPNISPEGEVCLSLLRQNSIDGMGWSPTRRIKDVIWGLSSLFLDLCNFDDPLNFEAAEHYERDKEGFRSKVRDWIAKYAKR